MFQRIILKITKARKLKIYLLGRAQNAFCALIKLYQDLISPNMVKSCRFYPSCSEYTFLAVKKYGTLRGSLKGVKRIIKCFPWHPGGIDLP